MMTHPVAMRAHHEHQHHRRGVMAIDDGAVFSTTAAVPLLVLFLDLLSGASAAAAADNGRLSRHLQKAVLIESNTTTTVSNTRATGYATTAAPSSGAAAATAAAVLPPAVLPSPVVVLGPAAMGPWGTMYVSTLGRGMFPDAAAKWIWSSPNAQYDAPWALIPIFTTHIRINASSLPPQAAVLHIIVDDVAEVLLNGVLVGSVYNGYDGPSSYTHRPLPLYLQQGDNTLWIRCTNFHGPAGLLASVIDSNTGAVLARTGATWTYWQGNVTAPIRPVFVVGAATKAKTWPSANIGRGKPFPAAQASWIWSRASPGSATDLVSMFTFFRTHTSSTPIAAVLHIIVDDVADVYFNGVYLATVRHGWLADTYYGRPLQVSLRVGANLVAIRARNEGGGGGLLVALLRKDTNETLMLSDASWSYTQEPVVGGLARVLGPLGMYPWAADYKTDIAARFPDRSASWIWSHVHGSIFASSALNVTFWKVLSVNQSIAAQLWAIPDDEIEVWVNGKFIGGVSGGWWPSKYGKGPLSVQLSKGNYTISLRVFNTWGAAAVVASLVSQGDNRVLARTDGSWAFSVAGGPAAPGGCPRPTDWCLEPGNRLQPTLCDPGDLLLDWVCATAVDSGSGSEPRTWRPLYYVLSSAGCIRYDANWVSCRNN